MKLLVIGAGGMGFYLSLALAKHYEVFVIDDDLLSGSGATRLPNVNVFGVRLTHKVSALRVCGVPNVRCNRWYNSLHEAQGWRTTGYTHLIDTTDAASRWRQGAYKVCLDIGMTYIRCSYDLRIIPTYQQAHLIVSVSNTPGFGEAAGYTEPPAMEHALVASGIAGILLMRHLAGALTLPHVEEVIL